MQVDPLTTFRGALQLLGKYDRPVFDALNTLLGGALSATPTYEAVALFGWIDEKDEATRALRVLLDRGKDRLLRTNGSERQQLIAAVHTAIVMSALLNTLRILEERLRDPGPRVLEWLYGAQIPVPSAVQGFDGASPKLAELGDQALAKLRVVGQTLFVPMFLHRYAARYQDLSVDLPEFGIWAVLGEPARARQSIDDLHAGLGQALVEQTAAMRRLARLMECLVGEPETELPFAAAVVYATNGAALDDTILPLEAAAEIPDLVLPTVGRLHQTPRFRATVYSPGAQPAADRWWTDDDPTPVRDDLELFLAGHFAGEDSTRRPLLLLGQPGAGKSLLTRVLAARLPPSSFTVVRVPLRRVDSTAPIHEQIAQAIDVATHGRVTWAELDQASAGTIRVVLLDGFDELLQALPSGRRGYLQEIADFQRLEAALGRPVAVIVTSRTIVADRATIAPGTPMIRLEEFDEHEIGRWVEVWNTSNAAPVDAGRVRPLLQEDALAYRDLVAQPLLLLMLALYNADPATTLEQGLTSPALYERLFRTFLRREVAKLNLGDQADREAERRLWRLTVAAFGMFNRGGLYIMDTELGADLAAFDGVPDGDRTRGQRTVGEFFFVHASEADTHLRGEASRCFEFLHATFGEYLVARHVVRLLDELADTRDGRRVDDDELFALLCHQPLLGRRQVLDFAAGVVEDLADGRWPLIAALLQRLASTVRDRYGTERLRDYRPQRTDRVREIAAYSANLVTLRVYLDSEDAEVPITAFAPERADPLAWWRSTVTIWRAGLDEAGYATVLFGLDVTDRTVHPPDHQFGYEWPVTAAEAFVARRSSRWVPAERPAVSSAQLMVQPAQEFDIRIGEALRGFSFVREGDFSPPGLASWAATATLNEPLDEMFLDETMNGISSGEYDALPGEMGPKVRQWLARTLAMHGRGLDYDSVLAIVRYLIADRGIDLPDLVTVVAGFPELLRDEPSLVTYFRYAGSATKGLFGLLTIAERGADEELAALLHEAGGGSTEHAIGTQALIALVLRLDQAITERGDPSGS
ncbi:NACHT domain-containing protein [Dactylosporangium cerinum]|uniref:NACHT domain-containing protein n=1 Tax=Dactylosporangium cerinum TaxID=1434730 RepID=A0ABV9W768_9ACTN